MWNFLSGLARATGLNIWRGSKLSRKSERYFVTPHQSNRVQIPLLVIIGEFLLAGVDV